MDRFIRPRIEVKNLRTLLALDHAGSRTLTRFLSWGTESSSKRQFRQNGDEEGVGEILR